MPSIRWLGSELLYLDEPHVERCGDVAIGCYGGNTSAGAERNEDAAVVVVEEAWRFAAVLDAHVTAESAAIVVGELELRMPEFTHLLDGPPGEAFEALRASLLQWFTSTAFRRAADGVSGETALLLCVEKAGFLFWFSVGDCLVYLLHPELAALGQFTLNQRSFYEWVGKQDSLALEAPAFSSGVKQLRGGNNRVLLATDGLFEDSGLRSSDARAIYEAFATSGDDEQVVKALLTGVHEARGRDSATLIAWTAEGPPQALQPSR